MIAVKLPKSIVTRLEMGSMNNKFDINMEISRKPKNTSVLNLIPRNIRIVSNFFAGPENIISDNKYLTKKYHFG